MSFEATDFRSEARSTFEIGWLMMSGCIPVARNERLSRVEREGELPLLELGKFDSRVLEERLEAIRAARKQEAIALDHPGHGNNGGAGPAPITDCLCDRLRTILSIKLEDCAFERIFSNLEKQPDSFDTQFFEAPSARFSNEDGLSYRRLYGAMAGWGRRVDEDYVDLMQLRLLRLPIFAACEGVSNGDPLRLGALKYQIQVQNHEVLTGWEEVSLPHTLAEAELIHCPVHFQVDQLLGQTAEESGRGEWSENRRDRIVAEAEKELRKLCGESYPLFEQAIRELKGPAQSQSEFLVKVIRLRQSIWDAPLLSGAWRKAIGELLRDRRRLDFFIDKARLSKDETKDLEQALRSEWTHTVQEFRSEALMTVKEADSQTVTVGIAGWTGDAVRLPRDQFPHFLQPYIKPGLVVEAIVNLKAKSAEDLHFEEMQLPIRQMARLAG